MFTFKKTMLPIVFFMALSLVSMNAFAGMFDSAKPLDEPKPLDQPKLEKTTPPTDANKGSLFSDKDTVAKDKMVTVDVDVKPNHDNDKVDLMNEKTFEIAILGTSNFDVNNIDPNSITLSDARSNDISRFEDINKDGMNDLILVFATDRLGQDAGSKELKLKGMTKDGQAFEKSFTVEFVNKS